MKKLFIVAILSLTLAVPSKVAQASDSQIHAENMSYEKVVARYKDTINKLVNSNMSQKDRMYLKEYVRQVERGRVDILYSISDYPREVLKQVERSVTIEMYGNATSHLRTRFAKYL